MPLSLDHLLTPCRFLQEISKLLCEVMENQLAPILKEKGCIRLIQCFLNPELMFCCPESPNPLQENAPVIELVPGGGHRILERRGKKIDPLHQLFKASEHEQIGRYVCITANCDEHVA